MGKVDSKTLSYKERVCWSQDNVCITVGGITNEFPIFVEINLKNGVSMEEKAER
jgi:hypothetical protein